MEGLRAEAERENARDNGVKRWKARADDRHVCFKGGPDGCLFVRFCEIVIFNHVYQLVESGGASRDDEDTDTKNNHYSRSLALGELQSGQDEHWHNQDHDVCEDLHGGVCEPDRSCGEAMLMDGELRSRPEFTDGSAESEAADDHP